MPSLAIRVDAARTGSISAAARAMGMSYRRAWLLVDDLKSVFGEPLVETAAGGSRGGGAALTPRGKTVLAAFRAMERAASRAAARAVTAMTRPS